MTCTRPDWDVATEWGSYWIGRALTLLGNKGIRIDDLFSALAVKERFERSLGANDPISFWGIGHGNEAVFTGQGAEILMRKGVDEPVMFGRICHLTACLCGVHDGLCESIAEAGAIASIGYSVEFIVGLTTGNIPEVPWNMVTQSLLEPDCEIEHSLADGKTCAEAFLASDAKSNSWIEYWRGSGHPDTDVIIYSIVMNRDHKALYGVPQAVSRMVAAPVPTVGMVGIWLALFAMGQGLFPPLLGGGS